MKTCAICHLPVDEGPGLTDPETGSELHVKCVLSRVPEDAAAAVIGVLAIVLVPTIAVWAS